MKLLKITDDVYIQPDLVTSVYIEQDYTETKDARYRVVISLCGDEVYAHRRCLLHEARGLLVHVVDKINNSLAEDY